LLLILFTWAAAVARGGGSAKHTTTTTRLAAGSWKASFSSSSSSENELDNAEYELEHYLRVRLVYETGLLVEVVDRDVGRTKSRRGGGGNEGKCPTTGP